MGKSLNMQQQTDIIYNFSGFWEHQARFKTFLSGCKCRAHTQHIQINSAEFRRSAQVTSPCNYTSEVITPPFNS